LEQKIEGKFNGMVISSAGGQDGGYGASFEELDTKPLTPQENVADLKFTMPL